MNVRTVAGHPATSPSSVQPVTADAVECQVPGPPHLHTDGRGCGESCDLLAGHRERQAAARHAATQTVLRAAADELVVEVYVTDTYREVIPWRVAGDLVLCLPTDGSDWLHLDLDDVYAAVTAARVAARTAVTR